LQGTASILASVGIARNLCGAEEWPGAGGGRGVRRTRVHAGTNCPTRKVPCQWLGVPVWGGGWRHCAPNPDWLASREQHARHPAKARSRLREGGGSRGGVGDTCPQRGLGSPPSPSAGGYPRCGAPLGPVPCALMVWGCGGRYSNNTQIKREGGMVGEVAVRRWTVECESVREHASLFQPLLRTNQCLRGMLCSQRLTIVGSVRR